MDFVRRAANPWGEQVLLGLSWDLFWAVVVLGAVFVVLHALFARRTSARGKAPPEGAARDGRPPHLPPQGDPLSPSPGATHGPVPDRVERHGASARASHWILALSVFVLLVTAFVPILGLQFPWVTIHWIAGLVLTAYLLYHVVDTVGRGTLGTMWIRKADVEEGGESLRHFLGRSPAPSRKPGKWALENKVFHHLTGLAGVGVILTGLFMMFRVDTWLWEANPYVLGMSDRLWGWMYVLHGLAAVGFVGLLMAHIYFAVRPDKLWITRSMFKGWITREEYLAHHDPQRWPAGSSGRDDAGPGSPSPERRPAAAAVGTSSSGEEADG